MVMLSFRSFMRSFFRRHRVPTPASTNGHSSPEQETIKQILDYSDDEDIDGLFNSVRRKMLEKIARKRMPSWQQALVDRYLEQLTDHDYELLRLFKEDKKHAEIATLMDMDVESVRRSLTRIYADLMEFVRSSPGDEGISAGDCCDGEGRLTRVECPPDSTERSSS
jgi:hypothetical protein